jgi:hypothetical protein
MPLPQLVLSAEGDLYSVRWDQWVFAGGLGDIVMADMGDTDGDGRDGVVVFAGRHDVYLGPERSASVRCGQGVPPSIDWTQPRSPSPGSVRPPGCASVI